MSAVTVRHLLFTSHRPSAGPPRVSKVGMVGGARSADVDLLAALGVTALAPAVGHRVKHGTRLLELALITSYLRTTRADVLVLRADDFRSSARRVKSFVSEAVGLGMLAATVPSVVLGSGARSTYDFDALPTSLAGEFRRSGARPDLLFAWGRRRLAGESRARARRPPRGATKEPRDRLNQLLPWAHDHNDHPLVMTWCYLTKTGITVDVYREIDERHWPALDAGDRWDLTAELRRSVRRGAWRSESDDTGTGDLFARPLSGRARVEQELYESAPPTDLRVAGRRLRGRWAPADLVAGEPGVLFLGVLEDSVAPEEGAGIASRLADRGTDDGARLSVSIRERLVLAMASERTGQPWELLDDPAGS
ncbi:hypothetical protein ACIGNX_26190 [Actinosynnema sp. NPDC053489]|uniref:hypothetical protein n=1 Tax=Actinosynnema sp. NPDC053489 TaxID=3363916 RepID=UPI0037C89FE2